MQNLHRNKRSLTLNLKTGSGIAVLMKLLASADLLVENFRPDVKGKLGIDFDSLHKLNPRLILVSLSGFGQSGPYRTRSGFDQIAQGMGGLMSVTGLPGQGPVRAGTAVADSTAGLYAAIGALVALQEREASGKGQWVQTSLLEAQIGLMDFQAARYLVDGVVPPQAGNDHPYSTPMGVYRTRNGHINVAVGAEGHWQSFCKAIDAPDLAADPDLGSMEKRFARRPELRAKIEDILSREDSNYWLAALEAASVPAGPIYAVDEVFADPQVQHLGIAQEVHHPVLGDIRLVGEPVTLSRTPARIDTPTPDAGDHNREILEELGYSSTDIDRILDEQTRRDQSP
jgi:crotonobetainyl-CoA:carnitine CoA-transferase CaiB-like acyl-CoA transferase